MFLEQPGKHLLREKCVDVFCFNSFFAQKRFGGFSHILGRIKNTTYFSLE